MPACTEVNNWKSHREATSDATCPTRRHALVPPTRRRRLRNSHRSGRVRARRRHLVDVLVPPSGHPGALCLRYRPIYSAVLVFVAVATIAAGHTYRRLNPARPECHVAFHHGPVRVRVLARVTSSPRLAGPRQLQTARALSMQLPGGKHVPLCGQVELRRPASDPALWTNQQIVVWNRLRPAVGARNPGLPSARLRWLRSDVGALLYAPETVVARLGAAPPDALERLRATIRERIAQSLGRRPGRALVSALVLGERGSILESDRRAFSRAGVSHLLAVSGLHLALVAAGLLALLQALLRRWTFLAARLDVRRCAAGAALVVALLYTLLTGAAPATVRACAMCCAAFLSIVLSRHPDGLRALCVAVLVILVADPLTVFQAGFQLSCAAVGGIMLALRRYRSYGRQSRVSFVVGLLLTSLGATLTTTPLVAVHFHEVSVVGVWVNLVAVPWTSFVVLPSSLLGTVLAATGLPGGTLLLSAGAWSAEQLAWCVAWVAQLPFAAITLSWSWLVGLSAEAAATALLMPRGWLRRALVASAVLGAVFGVVSCLGGASELEVTFLDVGQGDAALLRLPDNNTMLVDTGPAPWRPPGSSETDTARSGRVARFLRSQNIRRLDFVVVTHPEADHAGGLESVARSVEIGEIWLCWHGQSQSDWRDRIARLAQQHHTPLRPPRPLQLGKVHIEPIWPRQDGRCGSPELSLNNNSIVLRVAYGEGVVLLAGDIEREAEQALVRLRRDDLRAKVLKVPHHGSSTSSTANWLRAVHPQVAVVSSGLQNRYGFPHEEVLQRYRSIGAELLRVDRQGAIIVNLDREGSVAWAAPLATTTEN